MSALNEAAAAAVWSLGAAASFGYIHNINRYNILWAAIVGSAGWTLHTLVSALAGAELAGFFWGAFCIAGLSELCALLLKNPATIYLVPGLLPLVPGGGMFQTMREAVDGNMELALKTGFATLSAAAAIGLGLALASSIARLISHTIIQAKKRKTEVKNKQK